MIVPAKKRLFQQALISPNKSEKIKNANFFEDELNEINKENNIGAKITYERISSDFIVSTNISNEQRFSFLFKYMFFLFKYNSFISFQYPSDFSSLIVYNKVRNLG